MKKVIILHGMPDKEEYFGPEGKEQAGKHWLGWLREELLKYGITTEAPELPTPYEPRYEEWKKVFEQYSLDAETVLVGHSCGAGFLVRYLSEHPVKVGRVVLVAPWLDPAQELEDPFFDFVIDKNLVFRTGGVIIFVSQDDGKEVLDSVDLLKGGVPGTTVQEFSDKGHFTLREMGTREFPELLTAVLR